MLMAWRGNDKRDKERKTKAEREALDKVKKEEELREAKRAARKLNFLITQTELYSHFVGSKLKTADAEDSAETSAPQQVIAGPSAPVAAMSAQAATAGELGALDFDNGAPCFGQFPVRPLTGCTEDESALQEHARRNAQKAVDRAREKAEAFDQAAAEAFAAAGGSSAEAALGGKNVEINDSTCAFGRCYLFRPLADTLAQSMATR
jgi:DNA helicase INO80